MPRLPQQITKGRRPEAAVEFCPYRFMLAACGVVFEATGETTREKKGSYGRSEGERGRAGGGRNEKGEEMVAGRKNDSSRESMQRSTVVVSTNRTKRRREKKASGKKEIDVVRSNRVNEEEKTGQESRNISGPRVSSPLFRRVD